MNTVGTLRSILLASIAAAPLAAALAAPQVTPLGEADKHGAIVYSVTCDSGRKKILQCVRDDRHCGYAGDRPLAELIDEACAAAPAQAPAPPPADDALPFETAPAQP